MPNPTQQTDDELLERAKRLAGQFSDPRIVTILSALLIADSIHRGIGRITEVIATRDNRLHKLPVDVLCGPWRLLMLQLSELLIHYLVHRPLSHWVKRTDLSRCRA